MITAERYYLTGTLPEKIFRLYRTYLAQIIKKRIRILCDRIENNKKKFLEQREDKNRWNGQYSNEENLITYIGGGDQTKIVSTALLQKIML